MKKLLPLLLVLLSAGVQAQIQETFSVEMEQLSIANAPGVHSYSWGMTNDNKWIIIGGRIDGLHRRQPWAAFLEQDNNTSVYVIDPQTQQVWSSSIATLPVSMFEQLQSTNQQFKQRDSMLYITGGYGYSATVDDHITHPYLTAVSLNELADAVINGTSITPYFRQITDVNMKVTGGQLGYLDSVFYLVGGNLFDGRYNPQGPTFGPGFIQEYTNEIRAFKIDDDGVNLAITDYIATNDTINLHRRDYNMVPQIFPNGELGFTAFSGVFDYNDMPYLNTVDITPGNYTVNNTFSQFLSQYHSAKLPIYDSLANAMHTLFFGGMSQYTLDSLGNLIEDAEVPFVKTISRVTRDSNGSMTEVDLGYIEMPDLIGAGSEFIPVSMYYDEHEILDLNNLPNMKTLVGHIYGGIHSTAENIFFVNDGTQSFASSVIFEVYINKSVAGLEEEIPVTGKHVFNVEVYPNPATSSINLSYFNVAMEDVHISIYNEDGQLVKQLKHKSNINGVVDFPVDVSELSKGIYFVTLSNDVIADQASFVKQ